MHPYAPRNGRGRGRRPPWRHSCAQATLWCQAQTHAKAPESTKVARPRIFRPLLSTKEAAPLQGVLRRTDEEGTVWCSRCVAAETEWDHILQARSRMLTEGICLSSGVLQLYQVQKTVTVRVLKDCGWVQTELNGKVLFKPYTQHFLRREPLLESMMMEGSITEVKEVP